MTACQISMIISALEWWVHSDCFDLLRPIRAQRWLCLLQSAHKADFCRAMLRGEQWVHRGQIHICWVKCDGNYRILLWSCGWLGQRREITFSRPYPTQPNWTPWLWRKKSKQGNAAVAVCLRFDSSSIFACPSQTQVTYAHSLFYAHAHTHTHTRMLYNLCTNQMKLWQPWSNA